MKLIVKSSLSALQEFLWIFLLWLFFILHLSMHTCFSDFVFKIWLIRLGFYFPKQKILYLNSQPTDSQSGVLTTTAQSQLWVGDRKVLGNFQSSLTYSSWIHLILLIQLI